MKKYIRLLQCMVLLCPYFGLRVYSQDIGSELKLLKSTLEANHISPRTIDDEFSKHVFKRFIKLIDPSGLTLTQQEYAQLKNFETTLDDAYTTGDDAFLKVFTPIFKEKLLKRQEAIEKITSQPLDFSKKDVLRSHGKRDTLFHIANAESAYKAIEKLIKYACLMRYEQNKIAKKAELQSFLPQIRAIELRKIKRVLQHPDGFERYVANRFLLAIALCYDPHTFYMNKSAMQNFMAGVLPEGLSFGVIFGENEENEIVLQQLVPGSPAWNSNELHEGDVLLAIQWAGKDVIELNGSSIEEVQTIMQQSNQGTASFTVRKKDKKIQIVKLTKALVRQDENVVKGYIMHGKRKIGYISLPAFYHGMKQGGKKGCAEDVGSTILKMKKEGIEGLILDIRNNGGGSIDECVELAGIFIDEGALVVTNNKQNKPIITKDANRGTVFDAPLIVMVNRYSASASEILAATLQDYKRALIVGSNTFGKATGQGIVPVATGFVKVTGLKIYRINGKTAQFVGVQPDIELPDLSEINFESESDAPHAIQPDVVNKKVIYTPLPAIPVEDLRQQHLGRMTPSNALHKFLTLIQSTKKLTTEIKQEIPLDLTGFQAWCEDLEKKMPKETDFALKNESNFSIQTIKADLVWLEQDKYAKEMHEDVRKDIAEDLHVAECYQILLDWIAKK